MRMKRVNWRRLCFDMHAKNKCKGEKPRIVGWRNALLSLKMPVWRMALARII